MNTLENNMLKVLRDLKDNHHVIGVSLLLKELTECASAMSLGKLFYGVAILLRRKCVLGSLPDVRSRES